DERVERVRERGGAVLLKEEVSDPGEQVAGGEPDQDVREPTGQQRRDQADEADRGAGEMEPATRAVRMLGEVEGIEVGERRVSFRLPHASSIAEFLPDVTTLDQHLQRIGPTRAPKFATNQTSGMNSHGIP